MGVSIICIAEDVSYTADVSSSSLSFRTRRYTGPLDSLSLWHALKSRSVKLLDLEPTADFHFSLKNGTNAKPLIISDYTNFASKQVQEALGQAQRDSKGRRAIELVVINTNTLSTSTPYNPQYFTSASTSDHMQFAPISQVPSPQKVDGPVPKGFATDAPPSSLDPEHLSKTSSDAFKNDASVQGLLAYLAPKEDTSFERPAAAQEQASPADDTALYVTSVQDAFKGEPFAVQNFMTSLKDYQSKKWVHP